MSIFYFRHVEKTINPQNKKLKKRTKNRLKLRLVLKQSYDTRNFTHAPETMVRKLATLTVDEIKAMTVPELRDALTERGLETDGKKPTLVARLIEANTPVAKGKGKGKAAKAKKVVEPEPEEEEEEEAEEEPAPKAKKPKAKGKKAPEPEEEEEPEEDAEEEEEEAPPPKAKKPKAKAAKGKKKKTPEPDPEEEEDDEVAEEEEEDEEKAAETAALLAKASAKAKALIAKAKPKAKTASKVKAPEPDPEEDDEVEEPAPKAKPKAKGKPKAKAEASSASETEAPAPKAKKGAKTAVPEFPAIHVPRRTYTVTADELLRGLFLILVANGVEDSTRQTILTSLTAAIASKGIKTRKLQQAQRDAIGTEVEGTAEAEASTPEGETAPAPTTRKPATKRGPLIEYDTTLQAFVNAERTLVLNRASSSVMAKIVDGKIVPLTDEDLETTGKIRIYRVGGKPATATEEAVVGRLANKKEIAALLAEDRAFTAKNTKKPATTEAEASSSEDEGDDGKEVEVPAAPKPKSGNSVKDVQDGIAGAMNKPKEIDEATFLKFYVTQEAIRAAVLAKKGGNPTDVVQIAEQAKISLGDAQQIVLKFKELRDRYAKAITSINIKKTAAEPIPVAVPKGKTATK